MNISNSTKPAQPYDEAYWIISEVFISLTTLLSLYYLRALLVYLLSLRKKPRRNNDQIQLICIVTAGTILALGRCISDNMVAFIGWQTDDLCRIFTSVSFALYSASAFPVYFFLWKRQHKFYSSGKLKHLYNKSVLLISYCTIAWLVIGWLVVTVIYQIPSVTGWLYQATEFGCRDANDEQDLELLPLFVNVIASLGQITLLGLLLYPLLKCKVKSKAVKTTEGQPGTSRESKVLTKDVSQNRMSQQDNITEADNCHVADNGNDSRNYSESEFGGTSEDYGSHSEFDSDHEVKAKLRPNEPGYSPRKQLYRPARKTDALPPKPHNKLLDLAHKRTDSNSSVHIAITKTQRSSKASVMRRHRQSRYEKKRDQNMNRLIRKVFLLALACVFTDLVATLLQLFLVTPELAYLAIYDVNLMLNITCVVLSFDKWEQILIPWTKKCNIVLKKRRTESATSQTSIASASSRNGTSQRGLAETSFTHIYKARTASETQSMSSARTGSFTLSRPTTPNR